jgi:hypothetical protein
MVWSATSCPHGQSSDDGDLRAFLGHKEGAFRSGRYTRGVVNGELGRREVVALTCSSSCPRGREELRLARDRGRRRKEQHLLSMDLVDLERDKGVVQFCPRLGVVLNRRSCGASRRGIRLVGKHENECTSDREVQKQLGGGTRVPEGREKRGVSVCDGREHEFPLVNHRCLIDLEQCYSGLAVNIGP